MRVSNIFFHFFTVQNERHLTYLLWYLWRWSSNNLKQLKKQLESNNNAPLITDTPRDTKKWIKKWQFCDSNRHTLAHRICSYEPQFHSWPPPGPPNLLVYLSMNKIHYCALCRRHAPLKTSPYPDWIWTWKCLDYFFTLDSHLPDEHIPNNLNN